MPVPIPGPEVGSDSQKVKFLMIFGRPKTGLFGQISGAPGYLTKLVLTIDPGMDQAGGPAHLILGQTNLIIQALLKALFG